jgi:hypothetical protein
MSKRVRFVARMEGAKLFDIDALNHALVMNNSYLRQSGEKQPCNEVSSRLHHVVIHLEMSAQFPQIMESPAIRRCQSSVKKPCIFGLIVCPSS